MLAYVLDVAVSVGSVYAVVAPDTRPLTTHASVCWVEQAQALGTAHAFSLALKRARQVDPHWAGKRILVLMGDTPLVTLEDVHSLLNTPGDVVVLGMELEQPTGYGRLCTQGQQALRIVECKDAQRDPAHRSMTLCYSGVMALSAHVASHFVERMEPSALTGEYYLTAVVEQASYAAWVGGPALALQGVNTRYELTQAEEALQDRFRRRAVDQGAYLMSPSTTFLSYDTVVAPGVTLYPMIWIGPGVTLGEGAVIYSHSVLQGCQVHPYGRVGPFARLREGVVVHEQAEVGNFVETKNAVIGKRSKVKHLSYIGDTIMGEHVNIGAGVITCNYDGHAKHQTQMGNDVFVGSLSCLVAPVSLGDHSTIGAGSVITRSVGEKTLSVARAAQKDLVLPAHSKHVQRRQRSSPSSSSSSHKPLDSGDDPQGAEMGHKASDVGGKKDGA